jgi:hypothetical protein
MSVELSIIELQTILLQEDEGKCLRCGFINSVFPAQHGWIEWQVHFLHTFLHCKSSPALS